MVRSNKAFKDPCHASEVIDETQPCPRALEAFAHVQLVTAE